MQFRFNFNVSLFAFYVAPESQIKNLDAINVFCNTPTWQCRLKVVLLLKKRHCAPISIFNYFKEFLTVPSIKDKIVFKKLKLWNLITLLVFIIQKSNYFYYSYYDISKLSLNITIGTGRSYKNLDFIIFMKFIFYFKKCQNKNIYFIWNVFVIWTIRLQPKIER